MSFDQAIENTGLSPRVRGNRRQAIPDNADDGSIPARTGEPHTGDVLDQLGRVYPRAYGGTSQNAS